MHIYFLLTSSRFGVVKEVKKRSEIALRYRVNHYDRKVVAIVDYVVEIIRSTSSTRRTSKEFFALLIVIILLRE